MLEVIPGGPILSITVGDLDPFMIGTYRCPRGTHITAKQEKIISYTKIQGAKGTVKQMSGFNDWQINISFIYIAIAQTFVLLEIADIINQWKKTRSIPIIQTKLNALGIDSIVLNNIDFPDEDRWHELPVNITAVSDSEIDLEKPPLYELNI